MIRFYTILILILAHSLLSAQNFQVFGIDAKDYPIVKAKFFVADQDNNIIKSFSKEDFLIQENQITRTIIDVECSEESPQKQISTVLAIDVSKSMLTDNRLDWAKTAAKQWVTGADSLNEETAITTFSDNALLYSDFLNDSYILSRIIDTISVRDGTNYKNAFLEDYAGALSVVNRAKYPPIIIFLTDGVGLNEFSQEDVIDKARKLGAVVYMVALDISLPKALKDIAQATGGQYFENINSESELSDAYKTIRQYAENTSQCEISWYTEGCVQGREADFTYIPFNLRTRVGFATPGEQFPEFKYLNDEFAVFPCDVSSKYVLRLKAVNGDIDINGINQSSSPASCKDFTASFLNFTPPAVLPKDSILEIEITYNPTSNDFNFCQFDIDASSCRNSSFFAISQCLDSPPNDVYIKVKTPNGGEVFQANSLGLIQWSGTSKEDKVMVDYSIDSGKSWQMANAGKLYYQTDWGIPNVESDNCLVRVKKINDKAGTKVYQTNVDSNDVLCMSWNKMGNLIAVGTDKSTIVLINSITRKKVNEVRIDNWDIANDIQFLPDGVRLYVTIERGGLYLLNLLTKQFDFINNLAGTLELSNDETFMTITDSTKVSVFDMRSRTIVTTFDRSLFNKNITGSAISNDSRSIAICTGVDNDYGDINIFTMSNDWKNTTSKSMSDSTFDYYYTNIDWSADDSHMFTTSRYKTARYIGAWDLGSRTNIFRMINPHNAIISDLNAANYDNYIVTVDLGSEVKVWQLQGNELKLLYEFLSNSFLNNCIEWSPDETRFAVGTSGLRGDSLLTVYSVKPYPEVEDISDSVFSIVKTAFDVKPIDLGSEIIGHTKDSLVSQILIYNYPFQFRIDSVKISGFDRNAFSVSSSPNLPSSANNINQPDFIFSFTPYKEGEHNAKLEIYTQYGKKSVEVIGSGVVPRVETKDYKFGEILITKDSTIAQQSIKNNGSSTLHINQISLIGPSDEYYSILDKGNNPISNITNVDLVSGEAFEIKVKFAPLLARIFNARIKIEYTNEADSTTFEYINLYGEGIDPKLSASDVGFDNLICSETDTQKVVIYNIGRGTLSISDIQLNSLNFRLLDNFQFDEKINNNDSLVFRVEFNPVDEGILRDSILIFSNELNNNVSKIYLNARKLPTSFVILGSEDLVGVDPNITVNKSFEVVNSGRTALNWRLPYQSQDGRIIITSVVPNPTLPGDTSLISYTFKDGEKGESLSYKFAPEPNCADSIEIKVQVKDTSPILYTDFPTIFNIVCEDTLTIKIPITNVGREELKIDNIRLENGDLSLFRLDKKKFNLSENETDTLTLTFYSNVAGTYDINIIFSSNDSKSQNGNLVKPVRIIKSISSFNILETKVDFVFLGLNNPGNKVFNITNNGTVPIRWNLTTPSDFNIISVNPQIAGPGVSSEVTIRYNGVATASTQNMLFLSDSCNNIDSVLLNVVSAGNGTLTLKLDNERRKIGEIFDFNIDLLNVSQLKEAGVTSIKGTLVFNHSLMIPTRASSTIVGSVRAVPFEIKDLSQEATFSIEMEALWGDDSCTSVAVDNLVAVGNTSEVNIEQIPGTLCISDLCYEGGVRLIDLSQKLNALLLHKIENGSNLLEIELNLIESGMTSISLYDINGRKLKEIISENMQAGTKVVNTDLDNLAKGTYFIEINTPSITLFRKLLIVR